MSKHTPGPWVAYLTDTELNDGYVTIENSKGMFICTYSVYKSDAERRFSDANLIAAAPDLLAVCQRLLEAVPYVSEYDVPLGLWDDLHAAVNKATGGAE